ncbi:MAG: hypothetical protein POG74_04020 [Acidocella sp.]|nr:hypothetical protein [Acidocella sp.]
MPLKHPRKLALACTALAGFIAVGLIAKPQPAQARVIIGVGIGVPFYHPYFYRPYYYAPAPVYYAPPPAYVYAPPVLGYSCDAGGYVCPLHHPKPVDAGCVCPTYGGGRVGGFVR